MKSSSEQELPPLVHLALGEAGVDVSDLEAWKTMHNLNGEVSVKIKYNTPEGLTTRRFDFTLGASR